ncbi:MAG: carbamate kinase [Clostridiales bacterium]|nr:carbamate kinase [Clostridiales bacterium]
MHQHINTPLYVIALGGNAIIRPGEAGTIEQQVAHASEALEPVARLAAEGAGIVLTHGNGPVVGNILLRNEAAAESVSPMPLYIADADSEGGIGFMLQNTLRNLMRRIGVTREVATIVTQVAVDPNDPAFTAPSKPVGPHYAAARARELANLRGWTLAKVGADAWRRVVPSPRPLRIIETAVVRTLVDAGDVVIAAGGGGIPVFESADGATLTPIDAVVDKDWSSALLARDIGADLLAVLMEADALYLGWGSDTARLVPRITVGDAHVLLDSGALAAGSIAPKLAACVMFVEYTGKEALMCASNRLEEGLVGKSGTRITA